MVVTTRPLAEVEDRPGEVAPRRRALVRVLSSAVIVLPVAVLMLCVADWVVAVIRPATRDQIWLWYTATHFAGVTRVQAVLLLTVAITLVLSARRVLPMACEAALVLELGAYFFLTKIWPPTGDQATWLANSATPDVSLSEPLADVAHKIPYWMFGDLDAVRFVAPVFGVAAVCIGLLLARRFEHVFGIPRWVFQAALVASPLPFWYVTGYIENTFLAVPFLLLGVWFATVPTARRGPRGPIVAAAGAFAVAGLFHAGFVLMCAALGAWILLRSNRSARQKAIDLASAAGGALLTAGVLVGSIALLPVRLAPGNSQGGYDGQLLVPFGPRAGDPMFRFVFVSHAHLIEFSNIVVHALPVVVLAMPVLVGVAWRRRTLRRALLLDRRGPERDALVLISAMASVYLVFAASWGFDLGPVGDLDLMLTMDVGLVLAVSVLAWRLVGHRPLVLGLLLAGSGGVQFAFYAMKIADVWVT